ncbi:SDR family NAD(P)-dependent oxidoreductase [Novosphingobium sp. SL115]|uniref:SDR family NAD(P)-dependent oxidoreductase n=1 Tax=Novosphingobium sp. SL115 TaxID=2995150 RepID=UPI0022749CDE|nr:SDR family NAD(P)-dependent oxidoreductase [Novosphingobium sp. SL115]MCY1672703.1 SDR family NAD(P)-dependent oxidoreductase [Novosphingobium sp. SL115]
MATVAITGAGRGIGLEITRQHVEAGDRVLALVRNPEGASALADLAAASGGKLTVHQMDVGDTASVNAGAADSGSDAVDVLYNVAGVAGPEGAELESADWDAWDDTFRIMVQGPLRVLQAFLPRLGAGSKVINISSQLAASTWPYGGYYAYAGAKAALNRTMRSVAIDLKDKGVIVGLVHPGWVQTEMGGDGADITPTESAAGIRKVAADWTLETSGDFLKWNGEPHAW